ncbi:uncharacterized protein LOC122294602 [Carya illinoinensis]|uniref:uncharacterized protein LOC122294602 n=1 Tax=Carya illinoinensis TaxID=32201 RepID=UPI001C721245|nr:uncharacterized protein LOC122294602 [Carya illinoinensis]
MKQVNGTRSKNKRRTSPTANGTISPSLSVCQSILVSVISDPNEEEFSNLKWVHGNGFHSSGKAWGLPFASLLQRLRNPWFHALPGRLRICQKHHVSKVEMNNVSNPITVVINKAPCKETGLGRATKHVVYKNIKGTTN